MVQVVVTLLFIIHVGHRGFVEFIADLIDINMIDQIMLGILYLYLCFTRSIGDCVHSELGEARTLHWYGPHPVLGSVIPYL